MCENSSSPRHFQSIISTSDNKSIIKEAHSTFNSFIALKTNVITNNSHPPSQRQRPKVFGEIPSLVRVSGSHLQYNF